MRFNLFAFALIMGSVSGAVFAQEEEHADIEFGFDSLTSPSAFVIEPSGEETLDGIPVFEGEFEIFDPNGAPTDLTAEEPGFTTAGNEELLVNEGDRVFVSALDASVHSRFGAGYVTFYNPENGQLEPSGELTIKDNSDETADLLLNGGSFSGLNQQFLGLGEVVPNEEILHDHLVIDLVDDSAPRGAYGVLLQLESDLSPADEVIDFTSEPFWIILNNDLREDDFENNAVETFINGAAVPEPGTFSLLALGACSALLSRRRS